MTVNTGDEGHEVLSTFELILGNALRLFTVALELDADDYLALQFQSSALMKHVWLTNFES